MVNHNKLGTKLNEKGLNPKNALKQGALKSGQSVDTDHNFEWYMIELKGLWTKGGPMCGHSKSQSMKRSVLTLRTNTSTTWSSVDERLWKVKSFLVTILDTDCYDIVWLQSRIFANKWIRYNYIFLCSNYYMAISKNIGQIRWLFCWP